jgi:integrase
MPNSVLMVEDEEALRMTVGDRLRSHGYAVDCAGNGEEAFQKALHLPFDLIILDVMLPYRDGLSVCRDIRLALLKKLGIERCGFHAFRHGNATVMDQEQVPMATRQNRLGQSDARTTMGYTHAMSEDGRRFAARLGQMLTVGAA